MKNRLKAILEETKLEHLMPLFADQAVKDDIINYLDDSDLEKLGINKLGDRKRLLLAFARPSEFTVDGTVLLEVPGGNLPSDWAFAGARVPSFEIGKYPVLVEEWEWVRAWGSPHERYRLGMVLRRRRKRNTTPNPRRLQKTHQWQFPIPILLLHMHTGKATRPDLVPAGPECLRGGEWFDKIMDSKSIF
jgi:hypothetical protein